MTFLLAEGDSNWLKIVLPFLTFVIGWATENYRLKNKIKDRDIEPDTLTKKREVEGVRTAESLQYGQGRQSGRGNRCEGDYEAMIQNRKRLQNLWAYEAEPQNVVDFIDA